MDLSHHRRRLAASGIATMSAIAVVVMTACGVPTGEETFTEIPSEEIPYGLDETSTSTSTTSTTTTTVVDPPETTTTTTPVRLETFDFYFLTRGRLQPVEYELTAGPSADQIADKLEEGPPDDQALDTLIEDGLITATSEAGGVLTVDLDSEVFDRIPSTQQTEAIAQIVMTMLTNVRLVGQVAFTIDGEPTSVKLGNGLLSEVGQPVSFDDYEVLLVGTRSTGNTSTVPTTAPPTTSLPPAAPATAAG